MARDPGIMPRSSKIGEWTQGNVQNQGRKCFVVANPCGKYRKHLAANAVLKEVPGSKVEGFPQAPLKPLIKTSTCSLFIK
eukprot:1156579-Pelagomonas_calceolata.AAC.3